MKNCLLALIAGLLLCVAFGCNNNDTEEPEAYDKEVDGPVATVRTPIADYDVIGDPAEVIKRRRAFHESIMEAAMGSGESAAGGDLDGPSAPASDEEASAIKVVVESLITAKDAEDENTALSLLDTEANEAMTALKTSVEDLASRRIAVDLHIETKFGAPQYPKPIKDWLKKVSDDVKAMMPVWGLIGDAASEQLTFGKVGEKIVADGPGASRWVFSKEGDVWKLGLTKKDRDKAALIGELANAAVEMFNALGAGAEDGTITVDNIEAQRVELEKKFVDPVKAKLAALEAQTAPAGDPDAGTDVTLPPADGVIPPADGVIPPADGVIPPADGVIPPADGVTPPADGATTAPADGGDAPLDGGDAPLDGGKAPDDAPLDAGKAPDDGVGL